MSHLARSGLVVAVAAFVATGACSHGPPASSTPAPVTHIGQSILDGKPDSEHNFVVGVMITSSSAWCSGSLIAPNLVLTAQHCVASCPHSIQCSYATFGEACNAASVFVTLASDMFTAPYYAYLSSAEVYVPPLSDAVCGNDVALIRLAKNVPGYAARPVNPRVDIQVTDGEVYTAIGYGNVNASGSGAGARRYREGLEVLCVGGVSCPWSYDGEEREWQGNTGICQGDSGGPAIDAMGRVIGVVSRGAEGCTLPTYGSVYGWADWLKTIAAQAAQAGGYEPAPWVTGGSSDPDAGVKVDSGLDKSFLAPCQSNEQCKSGVCGLENDLTAYCSTSCAATSECSSGWHCDPVQGACLQNGGFGEPCSYAVDCRSGICTPEGYCSQACGGDAGSSCPSAASCSTDGKCLRSTSPQASEVKVESASGCSTIGGSPHAAALWWMTLGIAALLRKRR